MFPLSHVPLPERVETVRKLAAAAKQGGILYEFWPLFIDVPKLRLPETRPTMEALAELAAQGDKDTALLLATYEVELSTLLDFVADDNHTTRAALEALIKQEAEAWAIYEAQQEAEHAKRAAMNEDERAAYDKQQLDELKAWVQEGRKQQAEHIDKTPPHNP